MKKLSKLLVFEVHRASSYIFIHKACLIYAEVLINEKVCAFVYLYSFYLEDNRRWKPH